MTTSRIWTRTIAAAAMLAFGVTSAFAGAFEDGANNYKRGNYQSALNNWRNLSQTDATVQNNIGIIYMGGLYRDGKGVNRDFGKAVTYFSASAAQGNAAGQLNLGLLYMYGQVVRQDLTKAYMWFYLASAQNLKQAAYNRQLVATKMNQQAQLQAHNLAQRCADQNFKGCGA